MTLKLVHPRFILKRRGRWVRLAVWFHGRAFHNTRPDAGGQLDSGRSLSIIVSCYSAVMACHISAVRSSRRILSEPDSRSDATVHLGGYLLRQQRQRLSD